MRIVLFLLLSVVLGETTSENELTFTYDNSIENELTVTVTGTGNSVWKSVTVNDGDPAFNTVKHVVIGAGISEIDGLMFNYHDSVKTITATEDCTLKTIAENNILGCKSLLKIIIPTLETIGTNSIGDCSNLVDFDFTSIKSIGDKVFEKSNLKNPFFGEHLESLGNEAFSNMQMESITVHQNNKKFLNDSHGVLYEIKSDENKKLVIYPSLIPLTEYTIMDGTNEIAMMGFNAANNLVKINFNQVSKLHYQSFNSCKGLITVHLGKALLYIPHGAFINCDNIQTYEVDENNPFLEIDENGFFLTKVIKNKAIVR